MNLMAYIYTYSASKRRVEVFSSAACSPNLLLLPRPLQSSTTGKIRLEPLIYSMF
jgi:hypothetical protein